MNAPADSPSIALIAPEQAWRRLQAEPGEAAAALLDDAHQRNTLAGWRPAGLPWEQC